MSTDPLFEVAPPAPAPPSTAGERRRARQALCLAHGQHPLTAALRNPIPLHPDAPPAADRAAPGPRCGGCRFRQAFGGAARTYPKCTYGGRRARAGVRYPRRTSGPGTDVAAWWPACADYQPREG